MARRTYVKRYRNFGGNNLETMPAGKYLMGLVGVGIMFFVIGYGLQAGKETA